MAYNINAHGSIADALAAYRDDIFDTLNNIGEVLDNYTDLILFTDGSTDVTVNRNNFPMRLVYKDENITLKEELSGLIHLYDGKGNDKGLFADLNAKKLYGIIGYDALDIASYINGSYSSNEMLLEACDLALTNDSPDADISAMLGAKYGPQASSLSSGAKESLDNIQSYLQHTDHSATGVAGFISELYKTLNDTSVDSDGYYYQSSDKVWTIQGFVGAYAIRTIVQTAATVISTVITVVKPLIGIAIGLIFGALSKLKDMFLDFTSAQVHVNPKVTNNMLDMSLFDYDIDASEYPTVVSNYFSSHPEAGAVTYRMPNCTWIFTKLNSNNKFHLQIMCNIEFSSNYNYGAGNYDINNHTYTTIEYNGTIPNTWSDGFMGWFYNTRKTYDNWNDVPLNGADGLDSRAKDSVMMAYNMLFGMMANYVYGNGYTASYGSSMPSDGNTFDNAAWTSQHRVFPDTPSWEKIVEYRNMLRQATSVGPRLCQIFHRLMNNGYLAPAETFVISRHLSFPWVSQFYMEVPGYTEGAVWGPVLALGVIATVTIVAAVKIHKIKIKIKKFMARKQLDVEGKRYAYENAGTDEAFDAYWKSMRNYNKWALLTRYDKIDLMTGYATSSTESDTGNGYGLNLIKKVRTVSGEDKAIDLADLYRLIAGNRS